MNLQLEKKHIMILISLLFFSILLYSGAHFLYISPMKDSLALKESQLKTEQQLSKTLETRLSTASSSDFNSTMELQKTLPVDPMTEQLVLDLEKAEVVSNSYITAMEFSKDGQVVDREQSLSNEQGTTESDNAVQETETASEVAIQPIQMPDGVSKTSVLVTVESASYFELEKFIATLEELQRIVMVESILLTGPEEILSLSDEESKITMELTLNAFYLSGFDDLKGDNPKIDTPAPANKRNPFPTFGDYSEDNLVEQEQSEADDTEGKDEN
jgi:type IV pilus assembly protein PilO